MKGPEKNFAPTLSSPSSFCLLVTIHSQIVIVQYKHI